jgi:hypothetical protein
LQSPNSGFAFRRISEKQKKTKTLRALRLCLPYEIHVNEERSEFHWGGE